MPVHGISHLGLGLGWDAEHRLATAVLAGGVRKLATTIPVAVLPATGMSLAPYQPSFTGIDPDNFQDAMREYAAGVKAAGFTKLLLWSSHPWNTEIIDVVSRDIRIELELQTFVIELGGLGLSLHPRFPDQRAEARALASLLGGTPRGEKPAGGPIDSDFRPGNWSQLPPVDPVKTEPESKFEAAAQQLANLIQEIWDRPAFHDDKAAGQACATTASPSLAESDLPRCLASLDQYSGEELRKLAANQNPLVIIPIGAIEQHGPHLPVGVDTMIADAAAAGLKERLGEAVEIAPTLAFGKSNEHADYPGTVGMSARSLRGILSSQIRNYHNLGFRQFGVLNTHGGNSSVLTYTLRELQTELGIRAGILRLPVSEELDEQERTWGFHAGEWETSVMLTIAPELVDMTKAIRHYPANLDDAGELRPENAPAIFSWKTRDIAPDGVMGDATRATAAGGDRWLRESLDAVAAQIRALDES